MDKTNNYNSTLQGSNYNSLNYQTQSYQLNQNSSFPKVDSSTLVNQQSNLNFNQRNPAPNLANQPYNTSQHVQESFLSQSGGNQAVLNGTARSTQGAGEDKYKNKYSFKRNTVLKSTVVTEANNSKIQQPSFTQFKEEKIQNTSLVVQRQQRALDLSNNSLNQFSNQTNTIYTPRPSSNIINNVPSTLIPTPINIVIPPSPVRPNVINPTPPKPSVIPGPNQPFVIPSQPQPTIIPFQPQPTIIPSQPQPTIFPSQPQPTIIPSKPQPIIIPFQPFKPSQPQPPQPVIKPSQPQPSVNPYVPQPKPAIVSPQPLPVGNTNIIPEFVDKSQQYIKQIRQLRIKVEQLQTEKHQLIDQVRYYERQRFDSTSQETLRVYKEEIQYLKQRITQINVAVTPSTQPIPKNDKQFQELKQKLALSVSREKEYEYQLIQAQNHIIYLENISKSKPSVSNENFETEIKNLRQTIANYNEHVEHIESEKQEYKKYIISKEQQIARLYQQNNTLNIYLQQNKHNTTNPQNGIDPNQYYSLLAQFGKKDLQVIMLMQENNRLQKEAQDLKGFLEKAEDYILQLQQNQAKVQADQPSNANPANLKEIEIALQQEHQKFEAIKKNYENQIIRLTATIAELSKQSSSYETENKKWKTDIQTLNIKINELNQKIVIYQTQITTYKSEIQNITNINVQLTQQINVYKTEITNYTTQINQIKTTTTTEGVSSQVHNKLLIDLGKKELQVVILLEEINRLNTLRIQLQNHLKQAQDYILGAQQHIKSLESKLSAPSTANPNTSEIEGYKLKVKDLEGKLTLANQKISTIQAKQATHLKQIQGLQIKYKGIISQLDHNYSQVLNEKNTLVEKVKTLNTANTKVTSANISSEPTLELQEINKQLNIQLAQLTEHLINAESYIKSNSEKWQKNHLIEKQLTEKDNVLGLLNKEIQLTKDQNLQLNNHSIQLQKTIEELNVSQANNQNMTIVIRQKEEVEVLEADRHAQIQQLQLSLKNYIDLYNQAQAKLKQAEQQVQGYKLQIKKFAQLEGYLKKTEQFITEQELKWNSNLKNYQTENVQIKNHLMGAEVHIKQLQAKCLKLNSDYEKIVQQNKLHVKENQVIVQALNRAEGHIFEMEKLIHVKKP